MGREDGIRRHGLVLKRQCVVCDTYFNHITIMELTIEALEHWIKVGVPKERK